MAIEEDLATLRLEKKIIHVPACAICQKSAKSTYKSCLLVIYCSAECQKAHWAQHKVDRRSPLTKADWQPSWIVESRAPAFTGENGGVVSFGGKKYFWGNVPARDILQLDANEGANYQEELCLLFAASGNLRNVITTVSSLPSGYKGSLHIAVNDLDFDVVARNIIILLIALIVEDNDTAVNCMLHICYSAAIRQEDLDILTLFVRPLIEDVAQKVASKPARALLGKTWTLGPHTIRVELIKQQWDALLRFFEVPSGLTATSAKQARTAITLAPSRLDYRERHLLRLQPSHRLCFARFREDGILLPFGQPRDEFNIPNATFYQSKSWPMKDDADPSAGWDVKDTISTSAGPAKDDFYGKLFVLISQKLYALRLELATRAFHFRLTHVNATELPRTLADTTFARIEVSNISDGGYLGIERTVECFGPLLQSPEENPHATLITLFMNAIHEINVRNPNAQKTSGENTRRVMQYIPLDPLAMTSFYSVQMIRLMMAQELVRDDDEDFEQYMKCVGFNEVDRSSRLTTKKQNTIVEKWPMKLKLKPGQKGAQEEFDLLLSSAHIGQERYVEWRVKQ